jgi:hypothetical protein
MVQVFHFRESINSLLLWNTKVSSVLLLSDIICTAYRVTVWITHPQKTYCCFVGLCQKRLITLDDGTHLIRVEDEEAVRSLPARNSRWNSLIGGRRAGFSGCSLLDLTGSLYSWIRSWGLHVVKHYEHIIFSVAPNKVAKPCNMSKTGGHFYYVFFVPNA